MTEAYILTFAQNALYTALLLAAPVLIASLAVGCVISFIQATTQINEVTLTFVPKIIVISIVLAILGSWMLQHLLTYTAGIFSGLATMPR